MVSAFALRQTIGRIIANADTIRGQLQGPLRRDYANYASDIAAAGRHLMELADDLADLQAIELPDLNPVMEDIHIHDIARRDDGWTAVNTSDHTIYREESQDQDTPPT